jgi:hypothetical protein
MVDPKTGKSAPKDGMEMTLRIEESTASEGEGHMAENGHVPSEEKGIFPCLLK